MKFAKENNTAICFNAGTTGLKKGFNYLKKILESAQIVVMNKEEASMATGIQLRSDTKDEKFSEMLVHPDLKAMFKKLKVSEYQIIVITDGGFATSRNFNPLRPAKGIVRILELLYALLAMIANSGRPVFGDCPVKENGSSKYRAIPLLRCSSKALSCKVHIT